MTETVPVALWVVIVLVFLALAFDFMNGFHDAANSIATVVSTGVLRPAQAVMFAAAFNRADAVKLLLARGADAKATTKVVDFRSLKSSPPCFSKCVFLERAALASPACESRRSLRDRAVSRT